MPLPPKSPLHQLGRPGRALSRRGDARRWLGRQVKVEFFDQELLVGIEFGVAAQDQGAAIRCREADVEHLDGGELVEHGPWREAGGEWLEACAQRDVAAKGPGGDERGGL